MKRVYFSWILILFASLLFSSCEKLGEALGSKEEEELEAGIIMISLNEIAQGAEGGSVMFKYLSDEPVSVDYDASWFDVETAVRDENIYDNHVDDIELAAYVQTVSFEPNTDSDIRESVFTMTSGEKVVSINVRQSSATEEAGLSFDIADLDATDYTSSNRWIVEGLDGEEDYKKLADIVLSNQQYVSLVLPDAMKMEEFTDYENLVLNISAPKVMEIRKSKLGQRVKTVNFPTVNIIADYFFDEAFALERATLATESSMIAIGKNVFDDSDSPGISNIDLVTGTENGSVVDGQYWSLKCVADKEPYTMSEICIGPFKSINGNTIAKGPFYIDKLPEASNFEGDRLVILDESIGDNVADKLSNFLSALDGEDNDRVVTVEFPNLIYMDGEPFNGSDNVVSVVAPKLGSLGESVFENCSNLESVYIENVGELNKDIFSSCSKLRVVEAPQVTAIHEGAFKYCNSLEYISFPIISKIGANVFEGCTALVDITLATESKVSAFNEFMFGGDGFYSESLDLSKIALTIGVDSKTRVSGLILYARDGEGNEVKFGPFKSLNQNSAADLVEGPFTLATIPSEGTMIKGDVWVITDTEARYGTTNPLDEEGDFYNLACALITANRDVTLQFPNLTSLPDYAFDVPEEMESKVSWLTAFACLVSVEAPNIETIGTSALSCTNITKVDFPKATEVKGDAFYSCKKLESVNLPLVTSLGYNAFADCESLVSAKLPLVETVEYGLFDSCVSLKEITMENVTYIHYDAFYNCTSLESATFPELLETEEINKIQDAYKDGAFEGCTSLTTISMPKLETVGSFTFYLCSDLDNIELPSTDILSTYAFGGCSSLSSVDMPVLQRVGMHSFAGCTALTDVNLPKVTSIYGSGFMECSSLEKIDLPEAIYINQYAFMTCANLHIVDIPKVEKINSCAFKNSIYLTDMTLATESKELQISVDAFENVITKDINLTTSLDNGSSVEDNVWTVGENSFEFKSITH